MQAEYNFNNTECLSKTTFKLSWIDNSLLWYQYIGASCNSIK